MPHLPGRVKALGLAGLLLVMGQAATATDSPHPDASDVCLVLDAEAVPGGGWAAVTAAIDAVVRSRPELFPDPATVTSPPPPGDRESRDGEAGPPGELRLTILAGPDASGQPPHAGVSCELQGRQWLARLDRDFLVAGAERMLEQAPTTPGIESSIHLDWHADEARVRTRLEFAGPFDVPNGECWIDDALAVDPTGRRAVSLSVQGLRTSPFAEAACGRFFDELDRGGAGEQAITLLPVEVELADGKRLRFQVQDVSVEDDAIVIAGALDS